MGRHKKNREEQIAEVEKEITGGISEPLQTGTVLIDENPPVGTEGSNEFGEGYTIKVIADNEDGSDIFRIPHKHPDFEYRFIRETKENLSVKTSNLLLIKGGWQIVPVSHLVNTCKIAKELLGVDGAYHVGELVLCYMPKVLFAKKMAEDKRKTNMRMNSIKNLVEEGDPTRVKVKDVHGIMPGRMDGGRVVFDGRKNLNAIEEFVIK